MGKPKSAKGKKEPPPEQNEVPVVQEPQKRNLMFIKRFGKYGEELGNFRYPSDAIVLPGNAILVSDSWNNRIQVLQLNMETGESKILDSYKFPENMEPTGMTKFGDRIFICCNGFGATPHGVQEFGWSGVDPSKPIKSLPKEKIETGKVKKGDKKSAKAAPEPPVEELVNVPEPKLWPLNFFGNKIGSGEGEFAYPTCVAAHEPSGTLLVSDSGNFRMVVLKPGAKVGDKLTWVTSWSHDNEVEEGFAAPHGVSVDKDGFVYITDKATSRVYLYYHDKVFNKFKFLKVLIGQSAEIGGNNDQDRGSFPKGSLEKPFPDQCSEINEAWGVKVNVVCEVSKSSGGEVSASTNAANVAAAAAAHVGSDSNDKPSRPTPVSTMITITDKSHRIHSFMINITPNELLKKNEPVGEEGLEGGLEVTEGKESENKRQDKDEEKAAVVSSNPNNSCPYADYTVTVFHLSSYGVDHEESGSAGNSGTLDIPTSSCILRTIEKFPISNPNPVKRPSTSPGEEENNPKLDNLPPSGSGDVSSPSAGDEFETTKPSFSEYVVVVDSHNHGIVALGVNVP